MQHAENQERLLSHAISPNTLDATLQKRSHQIKQQGDGPLFTVVQKLALLHQLAEFDFGRYLVQHQGINGYWTHYMLTYPWHKHELGVLTALERYLLERSPILFATQERFRLFLKENQTQVKNGAKLACVPSGMLGELLYLDFDHVNDIELIGIDYDADTLQDARNLATKKGLSSLLKLMQQDAWSITSQSEFDLISTNGLTIYEPDDERVAELYRILYRALKPGGKLVASFLTPPPTLSGESEWDMTKINQQDLLLQKTILVDIIGVKFQCYRSTEKTKAQLSSLGFRDIRFTYDLARIFPTVVAYK